MDDAESPLEMVTDPCSPDASSIADINEDHQVTSPVSFITQSRVNGSHVSPNILVDQLLPRLVDYIHQQNLENEIDLKAIAQQVLK